MRRQTFSAALFLGCTTVALAALAANITVDFTTGDFKSWDQENPVLQLNVSGGTDNLSIFAGGYAGDERIHNQGNVSAGALTLHLRNFPIGTNNVGHAVVAKSCDTPVLCDNLSNLTDGYRSSWHINEDLRIRDVIFHNTTDGTNTAGWTNEDMREIVDRQGNSLSSDDLFVGNASQDTDGCPAATRVQFRATVGETVTATRGSGADVESCVNINGEPGVNPAGESCWGDEGNGGEEMNSAFDAIVANQLPEEANNDTIKVFLVESFTNEHEIPVRGVYVGDRDSQEWLIISRLEGTNSRYPATLVHEWAHMLGREHVTGAACSFSEDSENHILCSTSGREINNETTEGAGADECANLFAEAAGIHAELHP